MKPPASKAIATTPLCVTKELIISNCNGLHARPSALFVKTSNRFHADVWVEKDGERVNGKSIMGLMMLAAGKGSVLRITAEGKDAADLIAALEELLLTHFGEE
ncbi:MAG: HPr family phosphocarrier protein [Chthoniobacterales bacterium]